MRHGSWLVFGAAIALMITAAHSRPHALVVQDRAAQMAEKLTGRWVLNRDLSPGLTAPGEGRGGRGRGPAFAVGADAQRGGGRGGGGGGGGVEMPMVTTAEAAAQAALSAIQQVPLELTIDATPTEVTFVEPRGESRFRVDGRNTRVDVPGGTITVRSRWDRAELRQEFSSTQRVLRRSWSLDADGHLVLTQRIESLAFRSGESRAVFDRQ
jgi:hypothetical protein